MADREQYVFFDIDGTIYDYDNGVSPSAKEAVRRLRENGHHPVLCTGRTRVMIFDEIIDMGFDGIIGGAGTYIEWKGEILKYEEMDPAAVRDLIMNLRRFGFASYPEGQKIFYYDPVYVENGVDEIYRIYQQHIPEKIKPVDLDSEMHVSKISAMYTDKSDRDGLLDVIGDDYFWTDHGLLFETIPKHSSKGEGIRFLMDHLGASMEDTYAFGDSFNDLDMLQMVKHGVVMGNAKDSLKALIPLHADHMLNRGVYKALEEFGLI